MPPSTSNLLNNILIAAPCDAKWHEMRGNDRVRTCGLCQRNVYNIASMSREEAEQFFQKNDTACVRLFRRQDGTIITDDCPIGLRAIRSCCRTSIRVAAAILAFLLSLPAVFAQKSQDGDLVRKRYEAILEYVDKKKLRPDGTVDRYGMAFMDIKRAFGLPFGDSTMPTSFSVPDNADKWCFHAYVEARVSEQDGKYEEAERLYKKALLEAKSLKHDPALHQHISKDFAKLLKKLDRDEEARGVEREAVRTRKNLKQQRRKNVRTSPDVT